MKRSTLFVLTLALAVFLLGSSALMQQDPAAQAGNPQLVTSDAIPDSYVSDNAWHKLMIGPDDQAVYDSLSAKQAIVGEINYGSFRIIAVDEKAAGGRDAMQAMGVAFQDNQNLIALSGYLLGTTKPNATYDALPADLRKPDIANAITRGIPPAGGLYIVQFAGPIQDAWLSGLKSTGVEIVSYMPSNAYVVRGSASAAAQLLGLPGQNSFVQFIGDYE